MQCYCWVVWPKCVLPTPAFHTVKHQAHRPNQTSEHLDTKRTRGNPLQFSLFVSFIYAEDTKADDTLSRLGFECIGVRIPHSRFGLSPFWGSRFAVRGSPCGSTRPNRLEFYYVSIYQNVCFHFVGRFNGR